MDKLIEIAQQKWHEPVGVILAIVIFIFLEVSFFSYTDIYGKNIVIILSCIIIFAIWFNGNRIPKTPKGKIGFFTSIQSSDEEENKRIKEDFIYTLEQTLKHGKDGKKYHFVDLPKHIANKINDKDDALTISKKVRANFIIYGRARLREINNEDHHILELNGLVTHKPVPVETSDEFAKEFGELFPTHVQISTNNDIFSFDFTTQWTECVAKYMIGIASALSSDLIYAEKLFKEVINKIQQLPDGFPVFRKLEELLPLRLAEIYKSKAYRHLNDWRKDQREESLTEFNKNVEKISSEFNEDYGILQLLTIKAFLNNRDIDTALNYINKCKKIDDPIWHFNSAFLNAYKKDLKKAIREYRICSEYSISSETILQVEDFLSWILAVEPEQYQYHFCLGFFNWKIKEDLKLALNDFEKFLENCKNNEIQKEKELTKRWIEEISKELE